MIDIEYFNLIFCEVFIMDFDFYHYIIFSKSLYLPIREFTISARYSTENYENRLFEEEVLDVARSICDELNISFDDVYIYERCYFKD